MNINKTIVVASLVILLVLLGLGFWAWQNKSDDNDQSDNISNPDIIRYLPLGDSYTIGESVAESERWPNQLAAQYKTGGKTLKILQNPARTGYTTQDLIDRELPLVEKLKPDSVTIQIGVNDYVQGVDAGTFEKNLRYITGQAKRQVSNILLVTIPDYAKTPSGANFGDPTQATEAIKKFNQIIVQVAGDENLPVADVFEASQKVVADPGLVAKDGLHPSGKQYKLWTVEILETLKKANTLK